MDFSDCSGLAFGVWLFVACLFSSVVGWPCWLFLSTGGNGNLKAGETVCQRDYRCLHTIRSTAGFPWIFGRQEGVRHSQRHFFLLPARLGTCARATCARTSACSASSEFFLQIYYTIKCMKLQNEQSVITEQDGFFGGIH